MYNNGHIDQEGLRMRAILGNAQEEVPERVWDGVAAGLDKAAMRRKGAAWLWTSVAGAAAAAAVAVGAMLHNGADTGIVPAGNDNMIAVVQEETISEETPADAIPERLIAYAPAVSVRPKVQISHAVCADPEMTDETAFTQMPESSEQKIADEEPSDAAIATAPQQADIQTSEGINWEEENRPRHKVKASLVLSGVAGTNTPQQNSGLSPLKSPAIFKSPTKTTVEQTSPESTYGIPLSFGAGIKLNFTRRWSLGMGLNYTLLSSRFNGKYTKVEDDIASLPVSAKVRNSQHYIGIPINAYYDIVNKDFINLYAYAGGTAEKCILNRYEVQTSPVIYHTETAGGVQLSANAGIGVEFMLGQFAGLYIDPSLRYYFNCKQPKSIRTAQPLMLGFEMGLRFRL